MSEWFVVAVLIAVLIVTFWRVVIPVLLAILIALLVTGIGTVVNAIEGNSADRVVAPAEPNPNSQTGPGTTHG